MLANIVDQPLVKALGKIQLQTMHSPIDLVGFQRTRGAVLPPLPHPFEVGAANFELLHAPLPFHDRGVTVWIAA
jgi:hypothetical protein